MGDIVIHQWLSLTRLRPHHLKAFNAAKYYDDVFPYYHPRGRCPTCWMYDVNCRALDYREGAQPARLLFHGHRKAPKRPPMLYTGTFHKFWSWADCGEVGHQFCYGPCRAKPTQGQISLGNLALARAAISGRHNERLTVDSADSNVVTTGDETYAASGTGNPHVPKSIIFGYYDPTGERPLDHYDFVLRFKVELPANAVLLRVRLAGERTIQQTNSCWVRACLLDRDNMAAFVAGTGTEADNPRRDNTNGPERLNIQGGDLNRFEIDLNNGSGGQHSWYEIPDDIIRPIVQAFIQRPGYAPGQYLGIVLASDELNSSQNMAASAYCYGSGSAQLLISWREAGSQGRPKASRPPYLQAYQRFTGTNTPVPPEGNWPDYQPGIEAGQLISAAAASKMPDQPYASAYKHFMLLPVQPLGSWWTEEEHGPAPYPVDAHQKFPLNECQTYEVPCFRRVSPWRWRTLGDSVFPKVKGGLRGVVAYSADPAQNGYLPVYAVAGGDCVLGGHHYTAADENTWRIYHGQTQAKTYTWDDDPLHRGWWIRYTAFVRAWFAMDANWENICQQPGLGGLPGDPHVCMFRWNCWYQIVIRAKIDPRANPEEAGFRAWILTHEAGFGATVTPRHPHCNDVLYRCGAGIDKAMGDNVWPPEACQDVAAYDETCTWGDHSWNEHFRAPCKDAGKGYSWWYLPELNSKFYKSPIGQFYGAFPEYGLPHETKSTRLIDAPGFWQTIAITNPNACGEPCTIGTFRVGYGDDPDEWSGEISPGDSSGDVQTALEAVFGEGNVEVEDGDSTDSWRVHPRGDLLGVRQELLQVKACSLKNVADCEYSVSVAWHQRSDSRYNWAQVAFTTNLPWLLDASGEIEIKNTIHRLIITNVNGCELPPSAGIFKVGWADEVEFWSDRIWYDDAAAAVQFAVEQARNIGEGNVNVTGDAGGPWDIEYVGDLIGQIVPLPELRECTIKDANGCSYTVEIEAVQWGEVA